MAPGEPSSIGDERTLHERQVEDAVRPLVRALLRVMVIELNQIRVERMPVGPMTEAERHVLERGHLLRSGCCRSATQAQAS